MLTDRPEGKVRTVIMYAAATVTDIASGWRDIYRKRIIEFKAI